MRNKLKGIFLTRKNIQIFIIILMVLLIVLFAILYFSGAIPVSGKTNVELNPPDGTEPPVYNYVPLPRYSELSLNPELTLENYIDGEDAVTVTTVMYANVYYLFGTTSSNERDFSRETTGTTAFLARVTGNGSVLSVTVFGLDGDNEFVAAKNIRSGFAALVTSSRNNGDHVIFHLDYEGRLINTVNLGTARFETALDLYYYNNVLAVVSCITEETTFRKELYVNLLDSNLHEITTAKRITRVATLEYNSIFYLGGKYYIYATASEGLSTFPTVITFASDTAPAFSDLNKQLPFTRLCNVTPAATGGFLFSVIVQNEENKAKLVLYRQGQTSTLYEGATDAVECKILDSDSYYFCVETDSEGERLYHVSAFSRTLELESALITRFSGTKKLKEIIQGNNTYAVLEKDNSCEIVGISDTFNLKLPGIPVTGVVESASLMLFTIRDGRLYISFSDYLFPEALSV